MKLEKLVAARRRRRRRLLPGPVWDCFAQRNGESSPDESSLQTAHHRIYPCTQNVISGSWSEYMTPTSFPRKYPICLSSRVSATLLPN